MSYLLAVDPGLRNPAAALFIDGVLSRASRVKVPTAYHKLERGQRCLNVAKLIYDEYGPCGKIDEVVIEWPKVRRRLRVDPADLFPLVGVGMAVAGLFNVPVTAPLPEEWLGGNTPKSKTGDPWDSPRGAKLKPRLSPEELACIVPSHDAIDAVCIGMWRLGRFERIRSFIGAT